jgi:hypothetical protein
MSEVQRLSQWLIRRVELKAKGKMVALNIRVSPALNKQIEELSDMMVLTKSEFSRVLLEAAVEDFRRELDAELAESPANMPDVDATGPAE